MKNYDYKCYLLTTLTVLFSVQVLSPKSFDRTILYCEKKTLSQGMVFHQQILSLRV